MTATETVPVQTADLVTERIEKPERSVKRLRRKVKQLDREEINCLILTPEMEAELDRRLADCDANPGQGLTLEEFKAKIEAKYQK